MDTTIARFESARLLSLGYLARTYLRRTAWTVYESQRSSECYQKQMAWCRWADSQKSYITMEKAFSSCGKAEWRTYSASNGAISGSKKIQDGGRRHLGKISNGHISATGRPIHSMFGFSVGFSGTADLMALFQVRKIQDGGQFTCLRRQHHITSVLMRKTF